jgi:hypothetical protein
MKHKSTITNCIATGHEPDHMIATDIGFIVNSILLTRFVFIDTIRLKMLRNPMFFSKASLTNNFCILVCINHVTHVSLPQINSEAALAEKVAALLALPNRIVAVAYIITVIFCIA